MPLAELAKILIISNATSDQTAALERISECAVLDEVVAVEKALRGLGYQTWHASIRQLSELQEALAQYGPDLVFNLCEGLDGKSVFESHIASLLELQGIPFTGCNSLTLALARNKNLSKKILRSSGIRTPEWMCCWGIPTCLPENLHFPLICKPACEDASLGILADAVVRDFPTLIRKLEKLLPEFSAEGVLLEEFIPGREFCVALLPEPAGIRTLPPSEINFSGLKAGLEAIVSYSAKWLPDDELYRNTPSYCPDNLSPALKHGLQTTALAVHQALEANSYGRVDIRLDERERIFVLEYNPNPDITPGAGFSKALQAEKISYPVFVQKVLQEAQSRHKKDPQ